MEDDDADEIEFSDDESEAAWRRQQREPPKRRMHQSGPSYVIPNGALAAHAFRGDMCVLIRAALLDCKYGVELHTSLLVALSASEGWSGLMSLPATYSLSADM